MSQTYGFVIRFENLLRKSKILGLRKGGYDGKDSESVRLKIGNGIGWITEAGDNIRLFRIPVYTFKKAVDLSFPTPNKHFFDSVNIKILKIVKMVHFEL